MNNCKLEIMGALKSGVNFEYLSSDMPESVAEDIKDALQNKLLRKHNEGEDGEFIMHAADNFMFLDVNDISTIFIKIVPC